MSKLLKLLDYDNSFKVDLRYNSENNFTGKRVYDGEVIAVHQDLLEMLLNAQEEFKAMGLCIKIFDAYRPLSAQYRLWQICPDERFIADPKTGGMHNRGIAVDITLTDDKGQELEMPTGFDDFTEAAGKNYLGGSKASLRNRELLAGVMLKHGFARDDFEWWHFEHPQSSDYPILDVEFSAI